MIELTGLRVEDFIHPQERTAWKSMEKAPWLKKIFSWIGEKQTKLYYEMELLGNAIELTYEDSPAVFEKLNVVCGVLDFNKTPRVFVRRTFGHDVGLYYADTPILIIPVFILNNYDEDMLVYKLGRAVAQLKKSNCQLEMMLAELAFLIEQVPGVGMIALPVIANWIRKAYFTADRGGLLACQNIHAAAKALMFELGMPTKFLSEDAMTQYMKTIGSISRLANMSQNVQAIYRLKPWNYERVRELYSWYSSGEYFDVIEEFE